MATELPRHWIPWGAFVQFIDSHTLVNGSSFIHDGHWDCKYINARIDMRTGFVFMQPGHIMGSMLGDPDQSGVGSVHPVREEDGNPAEERRLTEVLNYLRSG